MPFFMDIYYEVHGVGEPIVFLHGLGASSSMFHPQVNFFKENFKVILLDLRGNGQSRALNCAIDEVLAVQATDVKMLLQHLEIEKSVFVGVSYGGIIGQKIAIRNPEIVTALVIVDSFCDTSIDSFRKWLIMTLAKQTWMLMLPRKWLAHLTKNSYKRWALASKELERIILQMRKREAQLQRRAINRIHFNKELIDLTCPTLCIVGDHSKLAIDLMNQVTSCIPNAEMKLIQDAFDPSNLCQPEQFNSLLYNFLTEEIRS